MTDLDIRIAQLRRSYANDLDVIERNFRGISAKITHAREALDSNDPHPGFAAMELQREVLWSVWNAQLHDLLIVAGALDMALSIQKTEDVVLQRDAPSLEDTVSRFTQDQKVMPFVEAKARAREALGMPRQMFAAVTREGSACSETALCSVCAGDGAVAQPVPDDCDSGDLIDCTGNEALVCLNCGHQGTSERYASLVLNDRVKSEIEMRMDGSRTHERDVQNARGSLNYDVISEQ